jgi:hypothetical protein
MTEKIVRATHKGFLPIGGVQIPCYVLEDKTRLITQRGIQKTIGMSTSGGTKGAHRTAQFVSSLEAKFPEPQDLSVRMFKPMVFMPYKGGGKPAYGYEATTLIDLCEFILKCHDLDILSPRNENLAAKSNVVIRAFAKVGIIAVIDEVTGYQEDRDKEELQKILAAYIAPNLMPYTMRFSEEFWKNLFRLRGWQYHGLSSGKVSPRGPRYAGKLTDELIYKQLPPNVRAELRKKCPTNDNYQRSKKLYRFLSEDVGDPHLTKQVAIVTTLMKISPSWRAFKSLFERAFANPNAPTQGELFPLEEEGSSND